MTTWTEIEEFGECPDCAGRGFELAPHVCDDHEDSAVNPCLAKDTNDEVECTECDSTGLAYWTEDMAREAVEWAKKFADGCSPVAQGDGLEVANDCLLHQLARAVAHGRAPAGSETQRCFAILLGVES